MAVDQNNNVIAVGDRSAFVGDASIFTRKFDIAGNLLWEKKDSTTIAQNYERASWVNTDADNNIYVCGYRYVGTSIDYTYAIVALKYNSDGDLIWKKDMEHAWPSGLSLRSEIDADGNYYIGFLNDYPDYETQGLTKEELVENLRSLLHDIRSDQIPFVRKVEELVVSA